MGSLLLSRRLLPKRGALTVANLITDVNDPTGLRHTLGTIGIPREATNLETNSGAETDLSKITGAVGTETITRSQDYVKFGSWATKVVCPGGVAGEGEYSGFGSGLRIPVTPSTVVTVSRYVWIPVGASMRITRSEYTAVTGGSFVTSGASGVVVGTGDWVIIEMTWTTAATTNAISIGTLTATTAQACTFYVDGRQTESGYFRTPHIETDGSSASRSRAYMQVPSIGNLLNPTKGWIIVRWKSPVTTPMAGYYGRLWEWGQYGSGALYAGYSGSGSPTYSVLGVRHTVSGGTVYSGTPRRDLVAGDWETIAMRWDATALGFRMTGAVFSVTANTNIPDLSGYSVMDIGSSGSLSSNMSGDFAWFIAGTGDLTDADVDRAEEWGNNDPLPHQLPQAAQLSLLIPFTGSGEQYRRSA